MNKPIVIFGLEGVLVDSRNRFYHSPMQCNCGIKFINSSHFDILNIRTFDIYRFFKQRNYLIFIFTTRSENFRKETQKWLKDHNIIFDRLEMRKVNDYRPGYLVKQDFLSKIVFRDYTKHVKAVFDQDQGCIQMYRLHNIEKTYICNL